MLYIFAVVISLLCLYLLFLTCEIHLVRNKLQQRLEENSQRPLDVQLMHRSLTTTVDYMNQLLAREQQALIAHKQEQAYMKEAIANISHDIRTPLTAIKGYQQLLEKSPLSTLQQQQLTVSARHVQRLEELLEVFFEYSYLVTQHQPVDNIPVNATALLQEVVAGYYVAFEQQEIAVAMPDNTVIVRSDATLLLRIFQNVLRNALKYADDALHMTIHEDVERATFTFCNTTTLEAHPQPERLLERFQTGDATRQESVGLGLAIVALLTEKLGGTLAITHEQFQFTLVITLPLHITA